MEGRTPLHGQASAAAAAAAAAAAPLSISSLAVKAESLGPLELLSLPGSVRVDAEFLGLVGAAAGGAEDDDAHGRDITAGMYLFPSASAAEPKKAGRVTKQPGPPTAGKDLAPKGTAGGGEGQREASAVAATPYPSTSISSWYSWGGSFRRREAASPGPPRAGDRLRLSDKRCVACYLPYNWPGRPATAASTPTESGNNGWGDGLLARGLRYGYSYWATPAASSPAVSRSSGNNRRNGAPANVTVPHKQGRGRSSWPPLDELYVVLDRHSFIVAVPDPDSPVDGGLLVCVAPLRDIAAKKHPTNHRVLELRISTKEEGRAGSSKGPGLFFPVLGGAAGVGNGDGSFRGSVNRGVWHLVRELERLVLFFITREMVLFDPCFGIGSRHGGLLTPCLVSSSFGVVRFSASADPINMLVLYHRCCAVLVENGR